MRILHFADLHIGVENYGRLDPATGLSTRLLDFLDALDQVVELALSQNVDLVLFAGDAYKSRDPSQTHQRELAKRLARLSAQGIPLFLVVGNHDLPNAVGRATALDIYPTLRVPHIHVGDRLATYLVQTRSGPLQVVALPWLRRAAFLTREQARSMTLEQVNQELERLLTQGLLDQAAQLDPHIPAILAGHVMVTGARVGTEQNYVLGRDHVLLLSTIANPAFDYVALGHVHKHQVLCERPKVVYSGSVQRVDFSEEKEDKGVCLVDLDPPKPQGYRLADFQFQQVKARTFLTIPVDIQPGEDDPTATVIRAIQRHHVAGAIVRVKVRLPADLLPHLREGEVRAALREAHYVAGIQREVLEQRRTRLPAGTAHTLSPLEALRLYLESRNTPKERMEILLQHAEKLMGEGLKNRE